MLFELRGVMLVVLRIVMLVVTWCGVLSYVL